MKKVRAAVIGLGSWGVCHLEAYLALPYVEVKAICDIREEAVIAAGERYGIQDLYTDPTVLLERDDIDVVSIVTSESEHLAVTIQALQTGKHVLIEKPVSTSLQETLEMGDVAVRTGRHLMPGHLLRFDTKYAEVYKAIREGQIGTPVSLYLKRARPKYLFATYQRTHTVYELTIHDLDIAIWYANSRVKSVKAYGRSVTGSAVPDLVWACLEFENGIIAVLESHWLTPNEANIMMADSLEVIGSSGIASFELPHSGPQIWNASGRNSPEMDMHMAMNGRITGALREQVSYLCTCILTGEEPVYVPYKDAIEGIRAAEAIIQSIQTGQQVEILP